MLIGKNTNLDELEVPVVSFCCYYKCVCSFGAVSVESAWHSRFLCSADEWFNKALSVQSHISRDKLSILRCQQDYSIQSLCTYEVSLYVNSTGNSSTRYLSSSNHWTKWERWSEQCSSRHLFSVWDLSLIPRNNILLELSSVTHTDESIKQNKLARPSSCHSLPMSYSSLPHASLLYCIFTLYCLWRVKPDGESLL